MSYVFPLLLSVMLVQNVKIVVHLRVENLHELIFMCYFAPRLENNSFELLHVI